MSATSASLTTLADRDDPAPNAPRIAVWTAQFGGRDSGDSFRGWVGTAGDIEPGARERDIGRRHAVSCAEWAGR
jgi:hypothetical protein